MISFSHSVNAHKSRFDILCKEDYPMGPPFVQIVTTGRGTVRFNPNLYADGKGR